jgi:hypothetical protein
MKKSFTYNNTCFRKEMRLIVYSIILYTLFIGVQLKASTFYLIKFDSISDSKKNLPSRFLQKKNTISTMKLREDNKIYGEGVSATFKSMLIPGWGLAKANNSEYKNAFFVFTPLTFGVVAWGFSAKKKSESAYQEYLKAENQTVINENYKKANDLRTTFIRRVSLGVFLYAFQVGATAIWGRYNDIYRERAKNWKDNIAFNCAPYYNPNVKSLAFQANLCYKIGINKKKNYNY